jgi:hypothetical protein
MHPSSDVLGSDLHGAQAQALGWSALDLFGVHPEVGVRRVDCCGSLMLSSGVRVVAVSADAIGYANGLVYRRRSVRPSVPLWEFEHGRVSSSVRT